MPTLLLVKLAGALALCLLLQRWYRKRGASPLPPGPRPLPLIGNILDLPPKGELEYQHWLKHREQFGPVSSVTIFGQTLVIIQDRQAAMEIIEKRPLPTASRPWMEFCFGMCGIKEYTPAIPYNEMLRLHRKLMHQYIGTKTLVDRFREIQEVEVLRTLDRMLNEPDKLIDHIRAQAGAIIIRMTYGYSIETNGPDPILELVKRLMTIFAATGIPGVWSVDFLPALKYLPTWFPGAGFKRLAQQWSAEVASAAEKPYQFVRRQMASNNHRECFVSSVLDKEGDMSTPMFEAGVKWSAASLYAGGSDTTVSTLDFFILALLKFPHVLRKAQEEIDEVVGSDRLPQFEDRDQLPYVEGVIKEAYRWQPVAPLGLPHINSEDYHYKDFLLPKGAVLLASLYWFAHDPSVYHSPDSFKPERYTGPYNEPDPKDFVFGFGRRICPGRVFADEFIFITIARILAVFNVEKAVDDQGVEIDPPVKLSAGVISHPLGYPFRITPRSQKHEQLIRSTPIPEGWAESDAKLFDLYGLSQNKGGGL